MLKFNKILLSLVFILLFTGSLIAQESIIGYVVDEQGRPLLGATVMVINQENNLVRGNTTDRFGEFSLDIAETNRIVINYIGFKKMEMSYADIVNDNWIVLREDHISLDMVVVSAMGRGRRSCWRGCGRYRDIPPLEKVVHEEKINYQPLSFYPNPTRDFVRVTLQEESKGTIEVINASGVKLKEVAFEGKIVEIDLAAYSSGTYFLRHINGGNVYVMGKVLKIDR